MKGASPKELLRRVCEELWAEGREEIIDEVVATDLVIHDDRGGTIHSNPSNEKRSARRWRAAFSDFRFVVDFVFGEGDKAVVQWTMSGTHTSPLGELQPTHKHFRIQGSNIWRFESGRVVEIWNHRDDLGLLQQLGLSAWPKPSWQARAGEERDKDS